MRLSGRGRDQVVPGPPTRSWAARATKPAQRHERARPTGLPNEDASTADRAAGARVFRDYCRAALVVAFPGHDPVPHDALELGVQLLDQRPLHGGRTGPSCAKSVVTWQTRSALRSRPPVCSPTTWHGSLSWRTTTLVRAELQFGS
jgi:hypothetical protein